MISPANEEKKPAALLRASAEAELASRGVAQTAVIPTELLLHELQVHQIELDGCDNSGLST